LSNERLLVNKLSICLTQTQLLANNLQSIISQDLLNPLIEHFANLSSTGLSQKLAEKNPAIITALCEILDFSFERKFVIERYITSLIKKLCLGVIKNKKYFFLKKRFILTFFE